MDAKLTSYLEDHDYLRNGVAEQMGYSRAVLSNMVAQGELQRVAQGVYALPESLTDEWAIIAGRSPNIVFSHESALALHKLHNRIPEIPSITIPQECNPPRSIAASVKVYRVKPECHELGKSVAETFMGHEVPCYDRERTVCDIIRSYSRIDIETYANALRTYATGRHDLPKLMEYARLLGIEKKARKAIEVLI